METNEEPNGIMKPMPPGSNAASPAVAFSTKLRIFVNTLKWMYAKTMPEWPHEYIVRDQVDEELFEHLIKHIRAHGYEGKFYKKDITYFEEAGMVYWTMGSPLHETTVINRCARECTYKYRLEHGTLP